MTHVYIARRRCPELAGKLCRIIKCYKSKCVVEFEDGYRAVTTIFCLRKYKEATE